MLRTAMWCTRRAAISSRPSITRACSLGSSASSFTSSATATASTAPSVEELGARLLAGERSALARAITLVESSNRSIYEHGQHMMNFLATRRPARPTQRIGLSGPPGAGKSTFIEALGCHLTAQGHRIAVLTVDPSSAVSGGSILGDKTRMVKLAHDPNAYVRPSPSSGLLGGVARNTNEAILLCEAAGYDTVLVETVGVGQSETAVADMVDMVALVVSPAAGDELQGLKRGIMEIADMVVVNKADGELATAATQTAIEYTSALKFLRPRFAAWSPRVQCVSSMSRAGVPDAWACMQAFFAATSGDGSLAANRRSQCKAWMWRHIQERLLRDLLQSPSVQARMGDIEAKVVSGQLTSGAGADLVLADLFEQRERRA